MQPDAGAALDTVAARYLQCLAEAGITRIFANAGTDFAPLIEVYRAARLCGGTGSLPEVVICPHENVAVSMAHGAYTREGTPQAVMVHTSVGTANALLGTMTAARSGIPLLVTAGRTPLHEHGPAGGRDSRIHWAQEMYDQAGMIREFTKWDYELRAGSDVGEVVRRALEVATSGRPGPVYLTLPREVLAATAGPASPGSPRPRRASEPAPDPAAVRDLAQRLATARFPILVTSSTGADPQTVPLLEGLAGDIAAGICEHKPTYMNASSVHPMHLGFEVSDWFAEADLLCFLDVDVPWVPAVSEPTSDCTVVQCGVDPHQSRYPLRTHRSDLSITGSPRLILEALKEELAGPQYPIATGRAARITQAASVARASRLQDQDSVLDDSLPVTKPFLNWALSQVRGAQDVVVSEYWCRPDTVENTVPGTYLGSPPIGGLGWGLPAAMGVALADPQRRVIATLGDGSYLFANPATCHQVMHRYRLPVLTVVYSNGTWGAVDRAWATMYDDLGASEPGDEFSALDPLPDFELYARASGAFARTVSVRSQVVPALKEGLDYIGSGRGHALVDVRLPPRTP